MVNSTNFKARDRVQIEKEGDRNDGMTGTVFIVSKSKRFAWILVSLDGIEYPHNIIDGVKHELIGEQVAYYQSNLRPILKVVIEKEG